MALTTKQIKSQRGLFITGVIFIAIVLAVLAFLDKNPTNLRYVIYRILVSFASAAMTAVLPGSIEIDLDKRVKAAGALAVFVLVYMVNPQGLP